MHKSLHFWLYAAGFTWWAIELYAQNSTNTNSTITGVYAQLGQVDNSLPGSSMLPYFIPAGAVYLFAGGAIAHKMGH